MSAPRQGIPFVVAAPSGTGKTTVCRRLVADDPLVEFSVSHTTRPRRAGEQDGVHYHFVARGEFERLVAKRAFLEWAEYNGNLYGTSWPAIEAPLERGHDVLLEIEIQGAAQVRQRRADARLVLLLPPSLAVLEQRLRARGTDSPAQIEARLRLARHELEQSERLGFDYAVVNGDLSACVAELGSVLRAERAGGDPSLRRRLDPAPALARLRSG